MTCVTCPTGEIIYGFRGISGSCYVLVPISGTLDGELYTYSPIHAGSLTGSSGAVVYGSGTVDGLPHPIGATQNADGTWSIQTDTELILSGNIVVTNVKVYSTNGTSGSLVYGYAAPNGAIYVTSSLANPVWITGSGVSVTSSCANPVWATLTFGCFTASVDSASDLHVYDTRVSASIDNLDAYLTRISGSVVAGIVATYAASSSIDALDAYLTRISGSTVATTVAVYAASSSIDNLDAYLTRVSGSTVATTVAVYAASSSIENLDAYLTRISGSVVAGTVATYAASSSIDNLDAYLTRISGSTVATTVATYAASGSIVALNSFLTGISGSVTTNSTLISSSIVAFASESFNEQRLILLMDMFKYQLGVNGGTYGNDAAGTTVWVWGTTAITGSTICPWILNTRDLTWHYVNLSTVTTASFTVSPAIASLSASLIVKYNKATEGYNSAVDGYQVLSLNPEYSHQTGPTNWLSESNGPLGLTTSSDQPMAMYSRFVIQMSRMVGTTCSLSATIDDTATPFVGDFYPITEALYGSSLINGDCYIVQDQPFKANRIRLNYYKTSATNGMLVKIWLY
jgi:phage tail protein X